MRDALQQARAERAASPRQRTHEHRERVAALIPATVVLALVVLAGGCSELDKRAYGATCGVSKECADGVCHRGFCSRACDDYKVCGGDLCIERRCHSRDTDLDGDGIDNGTELDLKLDPVEVDSDGDGLSDGLELGLPNAPTDTNGDGVIDALQSHTADTDGDCMVDAIDIAPLDGQVTNLPTAAAYCGEGVCAGALEQVSVSCRKGSPTHARVFLGCRGCGCEASGIKGFEATESTCDGVDNDCDGQTDEGLRFDGQLVGQLCVAQSGICALPGPDGAAEAGVVECGPAGEPVCSVGLHGSKTLAVPERCNRVDDDCDGKSDEDFTFGGLPTGSSCGPCGATVHTCEDGSAANPSVVHCSDRGGAAGCASTTFAQAFVATSAGRPLPRIHWTAAWSPKWQRLLVYSGAVHTATGATTRADLWRLDTASSPNSWVRSAQQPPGPREGGALVWDAIADRMILVGGKHDAKAAAAVWALSSTLAWKDVSAAPATAADRIPPLPANQGAKATRALVVGDKAGRWLVVFADGSAAPVAVSLSAAPAKRTWGALKLPAPPAAHANLSGSVECVAARPADSRDAYAMVSGPIGKQTAVYRLRAYVTGVNVHAVKNLKVPPPRKDFSCAVDGGDKLHMIGGHGAAGPSEDVVVSAALTGAPAGAAGVSWDTHHPANPGLGRDRAVVAWSGPGHELLVAGGLERSTKTGMPTRTGLTDAHRVAPGAAAGKRLDAPSPVARVGQAAGWSTASGFCIAGGLVYDLPAEGASRARLVPAADAWCAKDGKWARISTAVAPYAFGAATIDNAAQRFVMAGGLALQQGVAVSHPERLWQAQLTFADDGTGNAPAVSGAVQTISLQTGARTDHPKGPALAAPAATVDALRGRLLTFGGFSSTKPTLEMWQLELATMKWRELSAKWPGQAVPAGDKPLPQYGSLIAYSALDDTLLLGAGVQYRYQEPSANWGITFQVLVPDAGTSFAIDACHGDSKALTWIARTLDDPGVEARLVDTFANLGTKPPTAPLYRPHFGQPAFVPVLHDTTSGRGLVLMPPPRRYAGAYPDGSACPDPGAAQWTRAERPVVFALGRCDGDAAVFVESRKLTTTPDAWVLAATAFDDKARIARSFGGLRADGTASSALWSISQRCTNVLP